MNTKKKLPSVDLNDYLTKQLKNKDFKKEWEQSEAQYQFVRQMIKKRTDKKISQRVLAQRAGTTQAVISRIESGTVNTTLEMLTKIASGLDSKLTVGLK